MYLKEITKEEAMKISELRPDYQLVVFVTGNVDPNMYFNYTEIELMPWLEKIEKLHDSKRKDMKSRLVESMDEGYRGHSKLPKYFRGEDIRVTRRDIELLTKITLTRQEIWLRHKIGKDVRNILLRLNRPDLL